MRRRFEAPSLEISPQAVACLDAGAMFLPDALLPLAEICACGEPEAVHDAVADYLLARTRREWYDPQTGAEWLLAYFADLAGWTEHGSNIQGAWLTDAGLVALGFLCRWGAGWEEHEWVDAGGCSYLGPG